MGDAVTYSPKDMDYGGQVNLVQVHVKTATGSTLEHLNKLHVDFHTCIMNNSAV